MSESNNAVTHYDSVEENESAHKVFIQQQFLSVVNNRPNNIGNTCKLNADHVEFRSARGRPRGSTKFTWSHEDTDKLIDLWKSHGVLYDAMHPEYHRREVKEKAVDDIRNILNEFGVAVEAGDIHSKITSLKSYFCQERSKVAASKNYDVSNGGCGEESYVSRWRFYGKLQFLHDVMTPRHIHSESCCEMDCSSYINQPVSKKMKINSDESTVFSEPNTSMQSTENYQQTTDFLPSMTSILQPIRTSKTLDENSTKTVVGNTIPTNNIGKYELVNSRDNSVKTFSHHFHHGNNKSNNSAHERSEDEIFGELIVKKLQKIPDSPFKEELKLKMQQDINHYLYQPHFSVTPVTVVSTIP